MMVILQKFLINMVVILQKFLINMVVIATCLRKYMSTEEPLTVAYVKFSIGFRNRGSLIPVKPGCEHLEVRTMIMMMVMLMMVMIIANPS